MFLLDKNLLALTQDTEHLEKYLSQRKLKVYGAKIEQIIRNACIMFVNFNTVKHL
jgi:hypothetical protein